MILIIPALHIADGKCLRTAKGEAGTEGMYPLDPIAMARLWRGENAKALHVAVEDAGGIEGQRELLHGIAAAVDIPIQVAGGIRSAEQVRIAIDEIGAYRVMLQASLLDEKEQLPMLLERYGPRKIVIAMDVDAATAGTAGDASTEAASPDFAARRDAVFTYAQHLKDQGVQRLIVRVTGAEKIPFGPPAEFLLMLAERTNLSVTLNGSVRHFHDLKIIQDLHPRKIDSIILDEVLYSNAFPCQRIWRRAERQLMAQHKLL